VAWVIDETLKSEARQGAAYRSCEAKHQAMVEAIKECVKE
jgi:hypothetical protein